MNRRDFLQASIAGAAVTKAEALRARPLATLQNGALTGHTRIARFSAEGSDWTVWEDLRTRDGTITLVSPQGAVVLEKRTEAAFATANPPYLGIALKDIAQSAADLLADKLLEGGGDPDPLKVRDAAPPPASSFDPKQVGSRLAWTTFVGTPQSGDVMPVFRNGRVRGYRTEHAFPALSGEESANNRWEGLLGGWLPAVHKVVPVSPGKWIDLLVFADVDAKDPLVVQTWHRSAMIDNGKMTEAHFGYSYAPFPPVRKAPKAEAFYAALLSFSARWQAELADMAAAELPDRSWTDMSRHAFAKELVVRPGGVYPKYGVVDRDYFGPEYDGFQDTFTSSLYANLEWGRFAQAKAVLDNYFDLFVEPSGMVNMRGPEVPQFGLTLSLLARYLRYTGDAATLARHRAKIAGTADILLGLHDESLKLPQSDRGYGLLHGWSESDACLHPDPALWWKPYWNNTAFAARGLKDIAPVWSALGGSDADVRSWSARADTLQARLVETLRANIRRDLKPAYVGPLPGVKTTFREELAKRQRNEQGWSHRVYAELLHADVLPDDLANLVIDCVRGHGGMTIGVVANFSPANDTHRSQLGFISYGYAQQLLRLDRIEEYLLFLYSHRYHSHTPGAWVAGEVSGIDGDLPLFCIPAQLTIPLLVRWMLVFEASDAETLYLGRALPRDWVWSGKPISIQDAPTRWGPVTFDLRATPARRSAKATVVFGQGRGPKDVRLKLRVPVGLRIASARINGRAVPIVSADTIAFDASGLKRFEIDAKFA